MELMTEEKKRFKRTDIGLFPEDWEIKNIEDIAEVKGGKRLPSGFSLTEQVTPYPYIRVADMEAGGVDLSEIPFVPHEAFPKIKNYRIFKDDLFISVAGTLGIIGEVPLELDGANLTENADRITRIKCNKKYLMYVLMSPIVQNEIESVKTLGAQPKLALGRIKTFQIPLPPTLEEQQAIASALSDVDELIRSLDGLIQKKQAIKKGTMQQLLTGKKRLPGFDGQWEEVKLGDIAEFGKGKGLPKSAITPDGDTKCIHYGELFLEYGEVINEVKYKTNDSYNKVFSRENDVLMPTSDVTPNGLATASYLSEGGIILGGDILIIRVPKELLHGAFLSYCITINKRQIMQYVTGSTVYHLYSSGMSKFQFRYPDIEEQKAIVDVLMDMEGELQTLRQKREKYVQIKQGMMQELLTGKTRLINS